MRPKEDASVRARLNRIEDMFTRGLKARYVLLSLFLCWEAANFSGFSWTHLRRLSDKELVEAAIRYNYPNIHSDVADLKRDYSSFTPRVSYWEDIAGEAGDQSWNKFFGLKYFHVRLPDAAVVVTADGKASFSRPCRNGSWCSPRVAPDRPELGIVGTVQTGPPAYDTARDFTVRWTNGSEGSVFISGHCFAAYSQSSKPTLEIRRKGSNDVITIADDSGYRLIAIKDIHVSAYSRTPISKEDFAKSETCDEKVRAKWPNVGGASWKR